MARKGDLRILWVSITIYASVMILISINRHYTFRTNAFDLGIFMQSLWNTMHGNFMYNTVEWFVFCASSHFKIHLSPILLVLAPIYNFIPRAETLLIIQTIVIAISAYPLYILAEKILEDSTIALTLAGMYLGNSLVQGINSYDFHAVPFAMPFIFITALMIEKERYNLAILSSIMVLTVREDAGIALIALGIFYLFKNRKILDIATYAPPTIKGIKLKTISKVDQVSLVLILLGVIWILFGMREVNSSHLLSFYNTLFCNNSLKITYFLVVNLTLGLLTFLRPKYFLLLTMFPWAEILLSSERNLYRIGFQYPYMIIPLSIISIIYSLKEINKKELRKIVSIGITVGMIFSILTTPVLPLNSDLKAGLLVPPFYYQPITHHDRVLIKITDVLEDTNFSILTQNDIFPHLSNRVNTYVIWASYCNKTLPRTDVILLDNTLLYSMYNSFIKNYLTNYTEIYEYDGIEVWIRTDIVGTFQVKALKEQLEEIT